MARISVFVLVVLVAFGFLAAQCTAQVCSAKGTTVSATGYVMDNLCIQKGFLINNPTLASLQRPDAHSVECLLLQPCIDSNFTVLMAPTVPGGQYTVKYELGVDGTALIVQELKKADPMALGYTVTVSGIDDNTIVNGAKLLKCPSITASSLTPAPTPSLSPAPMATTPPPPSTSSGNVPASNIIVTVLAIGLVAAQFA